MVGIGLIVPVVVAVVEVDVPRVVLVADNRRRRPIIVRDDIEPFISNITGRYREMPVTTHYAPWQKGRTVKVARFAEVICKLRPNVAAYLCTP